MYSRLNWLCIQVWTVFLLNFESDLYSSLKWNSIKVISSQSSLNWNSLKAETITYSVYWRWLRVPHEAVKQDPDISTVSSQGMMSINWLRRCKAACRGRVSQAMSRQVTGSDKGKGTVEGKYKAVWQDCIDVQNQNWCQAFAYKHTYTHAISYTRQSKYTQSHTSTHANKQTQQT